MPNLRALTAKGSQWCGTPERVVKSRFLGGAIHVNAAAAPLSLAHASFASRLPTISL